jgi:hypothetical protein
MRAAEVEVVIVELHLAEQVAVETAHKGILLLQLRELPTWAAAVALEQVAMPHISPAKMVAKALSLLSGGSSNGVFCRVR